MESAGPGNDLDLEAQKGIKDFLMVELYSLKIPMLKY